MTTLGGELLKEIEGAEIQTNFLIVSVCPVSVEYLSGLKGKGIF